MSRWDMVGFGGAKLSVSLGVGMDNEVHDQDKPRIARYLEEFEASVRTRGLRMTNQRLTIARTFFSSNAHVTVDDLFALARKHDDGIGHATVYRTLRFLEDTGLAESHRFGGGKLRYEVKQEHHDHIICLDCGHIQEFENDTIEKLQDEIAIQHGFELQSHRMEIYGVCKIENCPHRK